MTERLCPKTNKPCEHRAGCDHIDACNMPVPISEWAAANPDLMEKLMAEFKAGRIIVS